jgi:uncharacterized RDD family membrane protein YckC
MSTIKIPTSFNIDVEFEIPEFYRRMVALLIDVTLEFFYILIANKIYVSILRNTDDYDTDTAYNMSAIGLLLFLPILVYHVVLEITMNGQSVGKKIMGMRVVNENGGRASISQFIIRWLLRVSDLWIVVLVLYVAAGGGGDLQSTLMILAAAGFLVTDIVLVASSKKGQRIGDMLAHTILIRTSSKASIEDTVFQEVSENYTPSFPQIMQLSDRDINAIKSIVETARKKGDYQMAASACDKIKSHLHIESNLSPFDFLDLLLKDYNYLSVK